MAICLATIADLYQEEGEKVKHFGYLSAISGASFVIGAFLGGKLSDPSIHPLFTPALPLWLATALTFGNFLFALALFQETSPPKQRLQLHLLKYFSGLKKSLGVKNIKSIYLIYFLFLFSWTILLQFTPVLVVKNFGFTNSNLADLALFMGGCWVLGSAYLNKILSNFFSQITILEGCLLGFTFLCALVIFPTQIYGTLSIIAGCIVLGGLAWPICTHMISEAGSSESQGKILGMSQSVQSAAMALAPPIAGLAYLAFDGLPFLLGAAASCAAGAIYFILRR
jgi:MFS family permease